MILIPADIVEELLDRLAICLNNQQIDQRFISYRDYVRRYLDELKKDEVIIGGFENDESSDVFLLPESAETEEGQSESSDI